MFLSILSFGQTILLFEDYESGDFAGKGWYDGFPDQRTSVEAKNGNYSYEGHFEQGETSSGAGRHLFPETDKLYMSYWVKYSENYIGSGVPYHPHEWNILTNKDWIYQGPADTYLTLYVEQNGGKPIMGLQDSKNVEPACILLNNNSFVGCNGDFDSYSFSENRSVASCNGLIGDVDRRDCFPSSGSTHGYYSSRSWHADTIYFRNTPGPYYKNDWHLVEAYFELNSIAQGIGFADGKIRYWYDGHLLITSDSILFRTGDHPDMKFNQLFYGGYIGVGSPIDQTWWVDDLVLADGIINTSTNTPHSSNIVARIYPNPTSGTFYLKIETDITSSEDYLLEIYTGAGQKIYQQKLDQSINEISSSLNSGFYYLMIKKQKEIFYTIKLIRL